MGRNFELVAPASSRRIELGARLGAGGAGAVYEVLGDSSIVVKVYHDSLSVADMASLRQKLVAMFRDPPDLPPLEWQGRKYIQIAWPQAELKDKLIAQGKWVEPAVEPAPAASAP